MTTFRYEVWTRPESENTFARRFPLKGVVSASFTTDLFGSGRMTLPMNHPRLDEIQKIVSPLNDVANKASIIRVYIGEDIYHDFYIDNMEPTYTDTGQRTVELTLLGRGSLLERTRIRQYDYNADPSVDPDWVYGTAGNELDTSWQDATYLTDFEDGDEGGFTELTGAGTNDLTSGPTATTDEAQTGTYSLKFDPTQRHSGVTKTIDVSPGVRGQIDIKFLSNTTGKRYTGYMKIIDGDTDHSVNGHDFSDYHLIELDNVVAAGDGEPPGSSDGTWQDIALDLTPGPKQESLQFGVQFDDHDGSNGAIGYIDEVLITGFGYGLGDWSAWGNIDTLTVDATPPGGMGEDVAIQWKAGDTVTNANGISQVVDGQLIGQTKTLEFDIYHEAGADRDFIIILKRDTGSWIASQAVTVSTATKTSVQVAGVIDTKSIYVQIRKYDTTSPVDVWVSGMSYAVGQGKAFIGKMLNDMLDSKQTGTHFLGDTVTRTFTDTLDSDGVGWDSDQALRFPRGATFRNIIEDMQRLGYEFSFDVNLADHTDWQLNAYNPQGMGATLTTAILSRPGIASAGPIPQPRPYASYIMVEGEELFWGEAGEPEIEAEWGPIDEYLPSQNVLDTVTLTSEADAILENGYNVPVVVTFRGSTLVPGINYLLGDIIPLNLSESIINESVRVIGISVSDSEIEPTFQVEFELEVNALP